MDLADYRLLHSDFALLYLLLPLGIWVILSRVRRGTLRFSSVTPFRRIGPTLRVRLRGIVPTLRVLALSLLILALCRPQRGNELAPERSRGIAILLVVDNSHSMSADDFQIDGEDVSRIEAVKHVASRFIKGGDGLPGRRNDEIGLVSFTGYPVPRAPLTLDHGAVLEVLETVDVMSEEKLERDRFGRPLYPEEVSTAIGDALALAASRLRDADVKSKVIILLSDGTQNMGELTPEESAKIAESFGIKAYTIGIGQAGITMRTRMHPIFGAQKVRVRSDLDERSLKMIAETTGGKYFNAATTGALATVYEEIDQLERSDIQTTRFYRWDEKFQPLALLALGCLLLELLLGQTVFRRLP